MPEIFRAKTREGYVLKTLSELLQNNIKTACFSIEKSGIKLCMPNANNVILFDLFLEAELFSFYIYKYSEPIIHIGINSNNLHKMLKTVKKCDSIELSISDDSLSDLTIQIIPKENNRTTTSVIKIQMMQNIEPDKPQDYDKHPIIVASREFQKMCKGLAQISNTTQITSKGHLITFSTDADGIMKRETEFGEKIGDDSDNKEDFSESFDTQQLLYITKIAGLSNTMQIFTQPNNPIFFKSAIGTLGKIGIYVKSKNLQEYENRILE